MLKRKRKSVSQKETDSSEHHPSEEEFDESPKLLDKQMSEEVEIEELSQTKQKRKRKEDNMVSNPQRIIRRKKNFDEVYSPPQVDSKEDMYLCHVCGEHLSQEYFNEKLLVEIPLVEQHPKRELNFMQISGLRRTKANSVRHPHTLRSCNNCIQSNPGNKDIEAYTYVNCYFCWVQFTLKSVLEAKIVKKNHQACLKCIQVRACRYPDCEKTNQMVSVADENNFLEGIIQCVEHAYRKQCSHCKVIVDDETANNKVFEHSYCENCLKLIRDHSRKSIILLREVRDLNIVKMILKFISGRTFCQLLMISKQKYLLDIVTIRLFIDYIHYVFSTDVQRVRKQNVNQLIKDCKFQLMKSPNPINDLLQKYSKTFREVIVNIIDLNQNQISLLGIAMFITEHNSITKENFNIFKDIQHLFFKQFVELSKNMQNAHIKSVFQQSRDFLRANMSYEKRFITNKNIYQIKVLEKIELQDPDFYLVRIDFEQYGNLKFMSHKDNFEELQGSQFKIFRKSILILIECDEQFIFEWVSRSNLLQHISKYDSRTQKSKAYQFLDQSNVQEKFKIHNSLFESKETVNHNFESTEQQFNEEFIQIQNQTVSEELQLNLSDYIISPSSNSYNN